jgi:hypothetical protein
MASQAYFRIAYGGQSNPKMPIIAKSYPQVKYYLTPLLFSVGFDSCKKRNFVTAFGRR